MFLNLKLNDDSSDAKPLSRPEKLVMALVITLLTGVLITVVKQAPKAAPEVSTLVQENINQSGVENPVTAVLLNFRSYDTLLELAVLLIVAVALLPAQSSHPGPIFNDSNHTVSAMLAGLLRWLLPLAVIVAGYLLWVGAYAPGGAFQAGAVLAGAGVTLAVDGRHRFVWRSFRARALIVLGLATFVIVASVGFATTGTTLKYPPNLAGALILIVESVATLSIAAILLLSFTRLQTLTNTAKGAQK